MLKKENEFVTYWMFNESINIAETVKDVLTANYQLRVKEYLQKPLEKISETISCGSSRYLSALVVDSDKVYREDRWLGGFFPTHIAELFNFEKRELEMRRRLSAGVIPGVVNDVHTRLEVNLKQISMNVREMVEEDVATRMEPFQKALDKVIAEKKEKNTKRKEIEEDIQLLEEVHSLIF